MNTADMKDMLTKMGGQRGQAGGMDAICKLSNGQNTQVTGADIKKAADPAALRAMASEQGMSPDEMCGHIAKILPQVIDEATPDGMVPQQGAHAMKDGAVKGKDAMNKGRDAMKNMAKK
jgi:uncharacterized protein YidB (DUF937 family)